MKKAISIFITIIFLASCSSKVENEVVGTWIGNYGTKIRILNESDLVEIESMPIDSNFIERPVDTTHFILPRVLEFENNGQFSSIEKDIINGKWKEKDNRILMLTDSVEAKVTITESKMVIELNLEEFRLIYYYERVLRPSRSAVERLDYLGKCWKIDLNDTNRLIYAFVDTNYVIITSEYGTDYGYWYNFNSKGIQCINTYNLDVGSETSTYVLQESGESKTNQEFSFKIPKEYNSKTTEILPLNPNDYKSLKAKLIGNWINKERFYPKDILFDDESLLIDFNYNLVFEDSLFKMKYSGKNKETLAPYERILIGKWTLDKYGNYITLNYQELYKNEKFDRKRFLTLYFVSEKEIEMTLKFRSLISEMNYSGRRINLIKE